MSIPIVGPVPPYTNPPIQPEFYAPSRFDIASITRGETTLVETTVDHNYVIGQQVRFIIPVDCGIRQLNEQSGFVISIPNSDEVIVDIVSKFMDPFVSVADGTQPQILAIGDINTGVINTSGRINTGTFVPGSFINIS